MKQGIQACISLLAALGLCYHTAAWAGPTDIAKTPVKATIFAKPNVIMGVDNSGSMDFEIIIKANDGALWWNTFSDKAWVNSGSTNAPVFNETGVQNREFRKYAYLFPAGPASATNRGLAILLDDRFSHFSVMPTSEFAWLRSSKFNSLYYNPEVTYLSWQSLTTAGYTFEKASPTATKPHPLNNNLIDQWNLTATRALNSSNNFVFTAFGGMTIPAGSIRMMCNEENQSCGGWSKTKSTKDELMMTNDVQTYRVAMPYWPATYWKAVNSCTEDMSASVADRTCTKAPDGSYLERVQIQASDKAQMQNFANWFQYYRKRYLMLNAAMGEVMESLTGLNMGYTLFNGHASTTPMSDLDYKTGGTPNWQILAKQFYDLIPGGGTPTRETLNRIGDIYSGSSSPIKYACQRNAAMIITDGFANDSSVTTPSYTKTSGDNEEPYSKTHSGTIADIALSYYRNRLLSTTFNNIDGRVTTSTRDTNAHLHMNTYGLTLGAEGIQFKGVTSTLPHLRSPKEEWLDPPADRHPSSIDDLWHGTINGRGQMYLANDSTETLKGLTAAFNDMRDQKGAFGATSVSSVNLGSGDGNAYLTSYNPSGWVGEVEAYGISASTAVIDYGSSNRRWSASNLLLQKDWTTRQIFTVRDSALTPFTATASSGTVASSVNPAKTYGNDAAVMEYLRGDRSKEVDKLNGTFRTRTSLIGPIVNSQPVISRDDKVLYVQSGEGMLHAFSLASNDAGSELWAFVPEAAQSTIGASTRPGYVYETKLDGELALKRIASDFNLLVGGMGAAGKSYHALNVHNPKSITETALPSSAWQFPSSSDTTNQNKMGLAMGRPVIVRVAAGDSGLRVLVSSGYETPDGQARLWVLKPSTGEVVREFATNTGSASARSEMAHFAAFGEESGFARYVYGGDLQGNIWRFDLSDTGTGNSGVTRVATLKDGSGKVQPISAAPELANISGKRVIVVGTGRLLSESDIGAPSNQTVYAISDGTYLDNPRSQTGTNQIVSQSFNTSTSTWSTNQVDWNSTRGWYIDLPSTETVTSSPQLARGKLVFPSNKTDTNCGESAKLYQIDVKTGSGVKTESGTVAPKDISSESSLSAVTIVQTNDGGLSVIGRLTEKGTPVTEKLGDGNAIQARVNAWRELRNN